MSMSSVPWTRPVIVPPLGNLEESRKILLSSRLSRGKRKDSRRATRAGLSKRRLGFLALVRADQLGRAESVALDRLLDLGARGGRREGQRRVEGGEHEVVVVRAA